MNMYYSFILTRKNVDSLLQHFYVFSKPNSPRTFSDKILRRFVMGASFGALAFGVITPTLARDNLIFESDFESGQIQGWALQDGDLPGAITVQSDIVRAGKFAVKLHMKRCSFIPPKCKPLPVNLNRPRAQLGSGGGVRFAMDKAYWLGFSVFIPHDWVLGTPTSKHNYHDVMVELHQVNRASGPGSCTESPQPLSFRIGGNRWLFTHTTNVGGYAALNDIATADKGRWTDFVIKFKFSYGIDGFFRIWKNGKEVHKFSGNTICKGKDTSGAKSTLPFLNATIYKANWKHHPDITERTVYYDEIRVGDSSASYDDVAQVGKTVNLDKGWKNQQSK